MQVCGLPNTRRPLKILFQPMSGQVSIYISTYLHSNIYISTYLHSNIYIYISTYLQAPLSSCGPHHQLSRATTGQGGAAWSLPGSVGDKQVTPPRDMRDMRDMRDVS